jgi:hypothetical protein
MKKNRTVATGGRGCRATANRWPDWRRWDA